MAARIDVLEILQDLGSSSKFSIRITSTNSGDDKYEKVLDLLAKTVSLGEHSRQEAEYWAYGIKYVIPREISFNNELTITFVQDEKTGTREHFIKEIKEDNKEMNIKVIQQKKRGSKEYLTAEYMDCFVKAVSAIELDSSSTDIPEFTVTFAYNWLETSGKVHSAKVQAYLDLK